MAHRELNALVRGTEGTAFTSCANIFFVHQVVMAWIVSSPDCGQSEDGDALAL